MENTIRYQHYEITFRCSDKGIGVVIRNTETSEIWESGPHTCAAQAVNEADKGLLWYFEAYEDRNDPERMALRERMLLVINYSANGC